MPTESFLLEIGTEELPPALIDNITNQIKSNLVKELLEEDIKVEEKSIATFNTPRRIAIKIDELPSVIPKKELEIKGPPKNKAFNPDNTPTKIGTGFSKKYNLTPEELIIKDFNGSDYVFVKQVKEEKNIVELLENISYKSIKDTSSEKYMKWGDSTEKFSRPIRWLLSLYGERKVDFSYGDVSSSDKTMGHRFLSGKEFKVQSSNSYEEDLLENKVIVSQAKRMGRIKELLANTSKKNNGIIPENNLNNLLPVVTNITEYPNALTCEFEKDFLDLPEIVITTVLESHQKYFVLKDKESGKLLSRFIVITNGTEEANPETAKNIKSGNEKVAKARLNDAKFFYEEDLKRPFTYEEKALELEKVTFQKGLGSMKEKVSRIETISTFIYDELSKQDTLKVPKADVVSAARLCKLDLSTQMVFEMPELQGYVGGIYAKENGFSEEVSKGISEHYKDTQEENLVAQIVGTADKIDNIFALFSIGKIPSSSADPFGLRVQAQWVFNSLSDISKASKLNLNLDSLISTYKDFSFDKIKADSKTEAAVKEFLEERFKLYLKGEGYPVDLIDAVASTSRPLRNILFTKKKVSLLKEHFINPEEDDKDFLIAAKRLVRIVKVNKNENPNKTHLKEKDELELLKVFEETSKKDYSSELNYFNSLKKLTTPINNFFDNILVNDPNPEIKEARHLLLNQGKLMLEKICDFNLIVERN